MSERPRRPYRLQARASGAEETRRRILAAARTQFSLPGDRPPSVESVAANAGVARTTIYAQFGSRLGLIEAVVMDAVRQGGLAEIIKASFDPDARQALRLTVHHGSLLWDHDLELYANVFALSAIDPDVASLVDLNERNRRRDIERLIDRAAEQRVLHPGLDNGAAADLMLLITSFRTYFDLRRGADRPAEEVIAMLTHLVETGLLVPEQRPTRRYDRH